MNIGIDKLNFFTPSLYVDLVELAHAREIDPNKFTIGIGQEKMAINPITQDTVSMGANAALPIVSEEDAELIDLVILGTESATDHSKAGATYIHELLSIQPFARSIEIKQACYGATAGLMMARDYVKAHPTRKALVIGSDIARYGLATAGEVTQGAGAVAMIICADPNILILEEESVALTENIFDFWRPTYSDTAIVDGKFSNEAYISFFQKIWQEYTKRTEYTLADFTAICFHLPYSKMGKKALMTVIENAPLEVQERLLENYQHSTLYTKNIGNIYTGSLFLGLCSLLDQQADLQAGQRIGLFSYGSGAVGEFFSGKLAPKFRDHLNTANHQQLIATRQQLTVADYETVFNESLPADGSSRELTSTYDTAPIVLKSIANHQRVYHNQLSK